MDVVDENSVLISDPVHIFYLTGLKAALETQYKQLLPHNPMVLGLSKAGGAFLIAGRSSLVGPFSDVEVLAGSSSLFEGSLYTYEDYRLGERVSAPLDFVAEELSEVMTEMKQRGIFHLDSVGVEESSLQLEVVSRLRMEFSGVTISGISPRIRHMRKVKDESELKAISEASKRLTASIDHALELARDDITEQGMFDALSAWSRAQYGEDTFLQGMILSGKRTSEVWGMPTLKKIERTEPLILDLQARVDGYFARSAVTVGPKAPREDESAVEGILSEALAAAESSLVPGAKVSEAFAAMAGVFSKSGMSWNMPHEAGHGIGLQIREDPFLIPNSAEEIMEGMVFCVTPGLYSNQGGSRLCLCFSVGKNGTSEM